MPYAQSHYPFGRREDFEASFPADFISENLDQTRGWFYTLTILAAALFDKPAFHNCIVGGMLLAADGRKLSKRLKNYPDPAEMLDTYGADALRLYLLNSPAMKAEEMRMTEEGIKQSLRDVIIPLWNAYSFFVTYATIDGWTPSESRAQTLDHRLDRWILSELQTLLRDLNAEMEAYRLYRTVPAMVAFIEKLTNWYIRRSRRRFWKSEDDQDKQAAYDTLYQVLTTFIKALAPVLPFITETIYQNLVHRVDATAPESIHLCDMPQADEHLRDAALEQQMELATRAVVLGRSLRSKHELKVRQPLRHLYLLPPNGHGSHGLEQMTELLADELNVKKVVLVEDETEFSEVSYRPDFRALGPRFGKQMPQVADRIRALTPEDIDLLKSGGQLSVAGGQIRLDDIVVQRREKEGVVVAIDNNLGVGLDVQLDDELIAECTAREFVNRVQNMRKEAGLDVADRIHAWVQGAAALEEAVQQHGPYIAAEILALALRTGELPQEPLLQQERQVNGHDGTIAIARA